MLGGISGLISRVLAKSVGITDERSHLLQFWIQISTSVRCCVWKWPKHAVNSKRGVTSNWNFFISRSYQGSIVGYCSLPNNLFFFFTLLGLISDVFNWVIVIH